MDLDKGRLLSAGYHNVMGYIRDDIPLSELILDEEGKRALERLWADRVRARAMGRAALETLGHKRIVWDHVLDTLLS